MPLVIVFCKQAWAIAEMHYYNHYPKLNLDSHIHDVATKAGQMLRILGQVSHFLTPQSLLTNWMSVARE